MGLERYAALGPEWARARECAARPEPTAIRVRGRPEATAETLRRLERQGVRLEPVAGLPGVYRVDASPVPLAETLEHWLGRFYIQQAVTAVAGLALGVEPGDRVLDLCAAPGGKTAHVADLLGAAGTVVAAERSEKRIRGLLGNLYRLGVANVVVVAADGRAFPDGARFDRVLVDVPCSGEGNLRRMGGRVRPQPRSFRARVVRLQEALLRRAVALARPGGTVLYVTCTFAPEENEGVVDRVLRDAPVELEPVDLDVPHAPGLTAFEGRTFHPSLAQAWRLYPHHLDSGGLFVARLRRTDGAAPAPGPAPAGEGTARPAGAGAEPGWGPVPLRGPGHAAPEAEAARAVAQAVARLEEAFGVPRPRLARLRWLSRGGDLWVHTCDAWPVDAWGAGTWRFVSVGLRAVRRDPREGWRPTNDLLRWLDADLRARVVRLGVREWIHLLDGRGWPAPGVPDGTVALACDGDVVGRGRARQGRVYAELPAGRARELRRVLERLASAGVTPVPSPGVPGRP